MLNSVKDQTWTEFNSQVSTLISIFSGLHVSKNNLHFQKMFKTYMCTWIPLQKFWTTCEDFQEQKFSENEELW